MAKDKAHHASKKNRYTVVLVPSEDAGHAKNYRFAPWHLGAGIALLAVVTVALTIAAVVYTPLSLVIPFSSPQLENKYNKELLGLNTKVAQLMEELVQLRVYNAKVRRAFGENVQVTDTGVVATPAVTEGGGSQESAGSSSVRAERTPITEESVPVQRMPVMQEVRYVESSPISFPAILPAEGYVTRGYVQGSNHVGIDIAGKAGSPIVAAADGHVVFSGWTYDYGFTVVVSHANGFTTVYKHNQSVSKQINSFVRRGEAVAALGNTGVTSSGPHLHFEIWKDGIAVDPANYLLNLN